MVRNERFEKILSEKTNEILVPFYDEDSARNVNALFNFVSVFFETYPTIKIGSLPKIIRGIVHNYFHLHASNREYLKREIKEYDPSEIEFKLRQALGMRSYNSFLVNMLKERLSRDEFSPITPTTPFSSAEKEILFEVVCDNFGLIDSKRKSLERIARERGWQKETPQYWVDFVLDKLREDGSFFIDLGDLWENVQIGRALTLEQKLEWELDKELFDMEVVLDHLERNPRGYGNESFRAKKTKLLLRLHRYGLTGPQIATELGIQRQTVYRHLNRLGIFELETGNGINRAIDDYRLFNSPRLKGIIERQVFQPLIESIVKSVSQDMGNNPLYQLLSITGRIRLPDISPFARALFYQHIEEPIEVIEEEMRRRLFNENGLSKRTARLLEKHLPSEIFLVLNCQYGFTSEKKTLAELGDPLGVCTSQVFYYKRKGLAAVRKNKTLRRSLLRLWRGAYHIPQAKEF
jgi:biotin operon repressor